MKILVRIIVLYVLIGNLLLPLVSIYAQDSSRLYRKYLTLDIQKQLEDSLPGVVSARRQIERFTDSVSGFLIPQPVTLPIVFHIMNARIGQPLVSETQVRSQINALNRDFNHGDYAIRHLADTREGFSNLVADMEISFCLADYSINGQSLSAIHYVNPLQSTWPPDNSIKVPNLEGFAPWDPEHIINVWVTTLEDGVSGFAQMPGGPSETDGIVIDYRFFGNRDPIDTPYYQGKTLTHLMGNYLNLYPIWGKGSLCSDDNVMDTPIHNTSNKGCPAYKHVTSCGNNLVEMTMNFMDNTDDPCSYMFTEGQKLRVHALLHPGGARYSLMLGNLHECDTLDVFRLVDASSPMENKESINQVYLYPNPANSTVNLGIISSCTGELRLSIVNALGAMIYQKVYSVNKGHQEYIIECRNWAAGIYHVQSIMDDQATIHQLAIE